MADRKITELSAMSAGGQATGDLLTIVDVSEAAAADKNKKITMANLFKGIPGNVGIGISAPTRELHVANSSGDADLRVESTNTGGDARLELVADNAGVSQIRLGDQDSSNPGAITYDHSDNQLNFKVNGSERLRITSSGNVGLGVTNPGTRLNIGGTSINSLNVITFGRRVDSAQTNLPVIGHTSDGTGSDLGLCATSSSGAIRFFTGNGASGFGAGSNAERMRIDSSGNVGIGVTNPGDFNAKAETLVLANGGDDVGITLDCDTDKEGSIYFADGGSGDNLLRGQIVYNHSGDSLRFVTNASERMRIDSSGNVGIGTTSPGHELVVRGSQPFLELRSSDTGNHAGEDVFSGILFGTDDTTPNVDPHGFIKAVHTRAGSGHSNADAGLTFGTSASTTTPATERMRIDSNGRLLVGTTSTLLSEDVISGAKSGTVNITIATTDTTFANNNNVLFRAQNQQGTRKAELGLLRKNNNNPCGFLRLDEEDGGGRFLWVDNSMNLRISGSSGHIGTTSGTVVGTQTSDLRLKNVGANVSYGLAEVKQLQPKQYALKDDPDVNKLGFIAQEVESIIPEAVFDTLEELDGHQEGDRTKLGMEYVQLIPVLVNAIKELSAEVDTLKTKVAALEAQ